MPPAAIILAAGESRRLGRPKAFLEIEGQTFVSRLTRIFREECDPVLLLVAAYPILTSEGATVVFYP